MDIRQGLINELSQEAASTRKMLEAVPSAHFDWKPHEKSMTLKRLATHVAELSAWPAFVISQDELDLAKMDHTPAAINATEDLVALHEKGIGNATAAINTLTEADMMKTWTLRKGDYVIFELPKIAVLRGMCFNHVYHHRGQLSVFLRLLDVKIPGMYGPSADDN